jgi:hypothetical protein
MPNLKTAVPSATSGGWTMPGSHRLVPAAPPHVRGRAHARSLFFGIATAAVLLASTGDGRTAAAAILHLRCANSASGANWPIVVDLGHGRVDSYPATITAEWISWHDPKQGFFDLERATGQLQLRNASSTGGYFLHYVCRPE